MMNFTHVSILGTNIIIYTKVRVLVLIICILLLNPVLLLYVEAFTANIRRLIMTKSYKH